MCYKMGMHSDNSYYSVGNSNTEFQYIYRQKQSRGSLTDFLFLSYARFMMFRQHQCVL